MALITGTETLQVLPTQLNNQPAASTETITTAQLQNYVNGGINPGAQTTTIATASPVTLTAAQVANNSENYIIMMATLAAGGTLNLPTVASIVAAYPNLTTGSSFFVQIANASSGAFAWTVTTATGWTLTGTMTIAQNTTRMFSANFTGATAITLTSVGTGTYS